MIRTLFVLASTVAVTCLCERNAFWHISDIHMQADYYKNSDTTKKCVEGKGTAGRFGDYNCRSPYDVEASAIHSLNSLHPEKKPSFILYTGDFGASFKNEHNQETTLMYLKNVTDNLITAQMLTGARIFPVNKNKKASKHLIIFFV